MNDMEAGLIFGILDALPEAAVLLGPGCVTACVNAAGEALGFDAVDFSVVPDAADAVSGQSYAGGSLDIGGVRGFARMFPVLAGGEPNGALLLFSPDEEGEDLFYADLPYVSDAMEKSLRRLDNLAQVNAGVLFCGEHGVGRESLARRLHARSSRRDLPFVVVDCAQFEIPDDNAGTVYFSGLEMLKPDERSALLEQIKSGKRAARFCYGCVPGGEDDELQARVSVLKVEIPPLRDRTEDIQPVARALLKKHAEICRKPAENFAPEVWETIERHDWPGNIRELENFVSMSVRNSSGFLVRAGDVPFAATAPVSLRRAKNKLIRTKIDALLNIYGRTTEGKRRAAEELEIGLSTLYRILAKDSKGG